MHKIMEYLQMLVNDANAQAKLVMAILHLPVVGFLLLAARHERGWLIRRTHKQALLFVLSEFRAFSIRQYNIATKCLEKLNLGKPDDAGNYFTGIATTDELNRCWTVLLQNPSVFLYHKFAFKSGVKLFALRDRMGFLQESTHDCAMKFSREFKRYDKQFFDNIVPLIQMSEMLEENQQSQAVNQSNNAGWTTDYLKIFKEWKQGGSTKDMEICYKQIVVKVLQLTKIYNDVSFIVRAGQFAILCDMAYGEVTRMKTEFLEKLTDLVWCHRLSIRMLAVVIRRLSPGALKRSHRQPFLRMTESRMRMLEKEIKHLSMMGANDSRARFFHRLTYLLLFAGIAGSLAWVIYGEHKITPAKTPPVPKASVHERVVVDTPVIKHNDTLNTQMVNRPLYDSTENRIYGIDISKYQGNLLEDIRYMDTLHFVICKATEGTSYIDPDFTSNWKMIRQKGLIRGAYHFYHSCDAPIQQAKHFLSTLQNLDSTDLPPIIDVETVDLACGVESPDMKTNLLTLLRYIEQKSKRRPVIYTPLYFADSYLTDSAFASYPLWLAEYSGKRIPKLPRAWREKGFAIWQRMDSYNIDSRKTDFDIFNGNHEDLLAFIHRY